MKIHTLGYGGAFDVYEGNSSFIVETNGKTILVDCGWDVFPKLIKTGWVDKIDLIYITHVNADHVGSLESLIYYRWFCTKPQKPIQIVASNTVMQDVENILYMGGMQRNVEYRSLGDPDIITFSTDSEHIKGVNSSGAFLFEGDNILTFSGDIGKPLSFLSTSLSKGTTVFHDASTFNNGVHCYYQELLEYKDHKNFYTYHHNDASAEILRNEGFKTLSDYSVISI